jgi:transcriptional regulator with XRE-family HTH domain
MDNVADRFQKISGTKLKKLRMRKPMTQAAFAAACGLKTSQQVSNIERSSNYSVRLTTFAGIVEALGITAEDARAALAVTPPTEPDQPPAAQSPPPPPESDVQRLALLLPAAIEEIGADAVEASLRAMAISGAYYGPPQEIVILPPLESPKGRRKPADPPANGRPGLPNANRARARHGKQHR